MAAPITKSLRYFLYFLRRKTLIRRHYHNEKCQNIQVIDIFNNKSWIGKCISISGWVKFVRDQKRFAFYHINDGSCHQNLQVVADENTKCKASTFASCIEVKGKVVESRHPGQALELIAEKITPLAHTDTVKFPFKKNQPCPPLHQTREHLHLRPKTDAGAALMRIRNNATQLINKYFQDAGYCLVHAPILSSNDCEGAGELFHVKGSLGDDNSSKGPELKKGDTYDDAREHFFDVPTYLTVSGQLHLEIMSGALSKVYCFGPTFRAENSQTRHHLSEFYMIEAEIAFTKHLEDIMFVMEKLYKWTTNQLLHISSQDIHDVYYKHFSTDDHFETNVKPTLEKDFIRLPYNEAIQILQKEAHRFDVQIKHGDDLMKEHEKYLVQHCGNVPVFLTDFPAHLKPFYARLNPDNKSVSCVDLLVPGVGELCGGSLREERYDYLLNHLQTMNKTKELAWYLELRQYGCPPHGGFGMGFERYLQGILGIQNIRDVIPFPRWPHNCKL